MLTQIESLAVGYVVGAYFRMPGDTMPHWYRLRNFGKRQGDAIEMKDYDLPEMEPQRVIGLARTYEASRIYKRIKKGQYQIVDNYDKDIFL